MFKKALVFAVTAACLSAGAAHAQSYDNRYDQRAQHSDRSGAYYNGSRSSHYDGRGDYRRDDRRDDRYDGRRDGRYDSRYDGRRDYGYRYNGNNGNHYGQRHHLRRGERLSHDHGRYYVVNNWRQHRGMYAPQRGYQWVQVNNDFALVAIASGLIAHVLLN